VQVFPTMKPERVRALLDSVGERSGSEWFGIAGRRLEAWMEAYAPGEGLIQALEDEGSYSDLDLTTLRRVSDELSGAWVEVRVSGRGDFEADMRQLVEDLLAEGGCAIDDHSPGAWSLEQIRQGRGPGQTFRA
jgi:hypothetical protein